MGQINKLGKRVKKTSMFLVSNYRGDSSVPQILEDSRLGLGLTCWERNRLTIFYKIQNEMIGIKTMYQDHLLLQGQGYPIQL